MNWNGGRALFGLVPSERAPAVRKIPTMRFERSKPVAEPTIEILMLETRRGAPTSTTTMLYEVGKTYKVPESLAQSFFSCRAADPAEAHAQHSAASQDGAGEADAPDGPEAVSKTTDARPRANTGRRKA